MTHHNGLPASSSRLPVFLLPIAVVLSLLVFVGTYFTYFYLHQMQAPGSYVPLAIGISTFFGFMVWFNYLALSPQASSIGVAKAVGIALAEAVMFVLLFLFLVLNTMGS